MSMITDPPRMRPSASDIKALLQVLSNQRSSGAALTTGQGFTKRRSKRLLTMGLIRCIGYVNQVDDHGNIRWNACERPGYVLTADGRRLLDDEVPF